MRPDTDLDGWCIGGIVAAEGTFVRSGRRFTFAVGLGASDRELCAELERFFRCGSVTWAPRRRPHYDDEVTFSIRSLRDHVEVTVPFMDEHLPASYKRDQYERWRAELVRYWDVQAKRVRSCSVEGCDAPRRAHRLCRHHLYRLRGV